MSTVPSQRFEIYVHKNNITTCILTRLGRLCSAETKTRSCYSIFS